MRKLILFLATVFAIWTVSLIAATEAKAQKKSDDPTITQVNTASPLFDFIYGGESAEKGGVRLVVYDRTHQYVSMSYHKLVDQAKGQDPKNIWVKLHMMPEIDSLAFRQSESLREASLPVNDLTVIAVRLSELQKAAMNWYKE